MILKRCYRHYRKVPGEGSRAALDTYYSEVKTQVERLFSAFGIEIK